jgi:hypothetical protein
VKIFALAAAVLVAGSVLTAASPFDGTWKLNVAKSQLVGDTFTYSAGKAGMIHYSNGSNYEFEFAADGKPYTTPHGYQVTWTKAAENEWDTQSTFEGKVVGKGHESLSADGKKLTTAYTQFTPDGGRMESRFVYERTTDGAGLFGTWKSVKGDTASDTMILAIPAPGTIQFSWPEYKVTGTGPTDGTPIPIVIPDAPKGYTTSFKAVDARSFRTEDKLNGKVTGLGTLTVSEDGKTLTAVYWTPGKENEKSTGIYEKK